MATWSPIVSRPTPSGTPNQPTTHAATLWALMAGNVVIGSGVMLVPGTLNELSHSLNVGIAQVGLLITAGAVLMGVGAPVLASVVAGWDRRALLSACLAWYGLLLGACALAPDYATLLPLRVVAMVAPAIFTPQAAASVGLLVPESRRGRAIAFVFLGWSVASVAGMPLAAWVGGWLGWRWAFGGVATLALLCAAWVWQVLPKGLRLVPLSFQAWKQTMGHGPLMSAVTVTLLSSISQFTLFSYFSAVFFQRFATTPDTLALLFLWFGAFGLMGNGIVAQQVDRWGAHRAVSLTLALVGLSQLLWAVPQTVVGMAMVLVPWGLGSFAANSSQQARLVGLAPALAPASVALNTSAMYAGQAVGSALGGWMITHGAMHQLHLASAFWLVLAWLTSHWAQHLANTFKK
jgi:predicted MFS family arabinose efflux permease